MLADPWRLLNQKKPLNNVEITFICFSSVFYSQVCTLLLSGGSLKYDILLQVMEMQVLSSLTQTIRLAGLWGLLYPKKPLNKVEITFICCSSVSYS
jgi:hypothetical protein